jgi:hypothetical protein
MAREVTTAEVIVALDKKILYYEEKLKEARAVRAVLTDTPAIPGKKPRDHRRMSPGDGPIQLANVLSADKEISTVAAVRASKVPKKSVEKYLAKFGKRTKKGVYKLDGAQIAALKAYGDGRKGGPQA